ALRALCPMLFDEPPCFAPDRRGPWNAAEARLDARGEKRPREQKDSARTERDAELAPELTRLALAVVAARDLHERHEPAQAEQREIGGCARDQCGHRGAPTSRSRGLSRSAARRA